MFKKFLEPSVVSNRLFGFHFNKRKASRMPRRQSSVKHNLHCEVRQVDVPGLDQRIQEVNAVLQRQVEYVGVEKIEDHDPHLLIASSAELSYGAKPLCTFQFLSRYP